MLFEFKETQLVIKPSFISELPSIRQNYCYHNNNNGVIELISIRDLIMYGNWNLRSIAHRSEYVMIAFIPTDPAVHITVISCCSSF